MKNDTELIESIKRHEGLKLNPYRCTAGKLTIGYGRNLEDEGISQREAEILLKNDIAKSFEDARSLDYFDGLSFERQNVIVEMVFNMGLPRVRMFRKMAAAIHQGDFNEAARQMINSKWAEQVKHRATELAVKMKRGDKT